MVSIYFPWPKALGKCQKFEAILEIEQLYIKVQPVYEHVQECILQNPISSKNISYWHSKI